MNTVVKLIAGLALLGATLATPAMAQSGKRSTAKAQSYASSPRNATGGYSPSNPNVPPRSGTEICY
jgi:hypothetical protein